MEKTVDDIIKALPLEDREIIEERIRHLMLEIEMQERLMADYRYEIRSLKAQADDYRYEIGSLEHRLFLR